MSSIINTTVNHQDDIQCLFSEGIQIWGTTQEVLEEQALKELEIFVEDNQEATATHSSTPSDVGSTANASFTTSITQHVSEDLNSNTDPPTAQVCLLSPNALIEETNIQNKDEEPSTSQVYLLTANALLEETADIQNEDEYNPVDSDSEYIPSEGELLDDEEDYKPETSATEPSINSRRPKRSRKRTASASSRLLKVVDDALESNYKARLDNYYKRLETELESLGVQQQEGKKEYRKLKGGLKVPNETWDRLYEYQKEGIYWLWELHERSSGGLLGDEMGLGKTVQVIVFLQALQYTRYVSRHCRYVGMGPTIIVCPATVIHQWVKHFHEWAPEFRVVILHQSGTHQGHKPKLIDEVNKSKGILITTYASILKYKGNLCEYNWHYFILDEGHKIRNPTAKITIAVKELRTPHRIMLTGSPMQNNLTELWSLFDFTNPGMLGNLATFTEHFANPILQGGFANASTMQEATALSVASTLKNVISPFLLRRMKSDVNEDIHLPHKSEQVLFCSLTHQQREIYKDYLMSEQVNNVLGRGIKTWRSDNFMRGHMLMAITALRKICNHPDIFIYDEEPPALEEGCSSSEETSYGYYKKSGKMVVVSALLKIWKKQGHRALLFSQGRAMIRMFESFLEQQGYKYLKMDGATNISSRQSLIDKFNQDCSYNVFLLTTRVGGLGVNLTGANRVIIYDPDWNPATDSQARERAWRIGQEKSVAIYRLLCAGTVEEKMYQRQVWKQLLSNKVLVDPTTNKFFKSSDLFDLFSLPESPQAKPETTNIFRESRVKVQEKIEEKKLKKANNKKKNADAATTVTTELSESPPDKVEEFFSPDKIQAMKNLAQQIAKSLNKKPSSEPNKKNAYQLELEEERNKKLKEKEKLKQLTPQELIEYNRWKSQHCEDDKFNKMDDKVTKTSFEEALQQSSKTAIMYHKLTSGQIKQSDLKALVASKNTVDEEKTSAKKRKHKSSSASVDTSGKIDGEQVEGLVKRETKKRKKSPKRPNNAHSQDNYILEHLFAKKGVSGALEHESVFNAGKKPQSLKVRTYADERALKALDALKKSKVDNWKW